MARADRRTVAELFAVQPMRIFRKWVSPVNRDKFLKGLESLWHENAEMREPLTIEDLLDDAATLGVAGASEMYGVLLEEEIRRQKKMVVDLDPETGGD